ncbi:eukaryotic translation initiation factor [Diachasma alloeum]|uniref:eukaryotic translation initiation factor n=1 Tax=Diachasma alloeum TaxID=454923 RepID=UPI0007384C90|nr:eukaryotic translation initiation factor [Diachasma alloeum]
MSSVQRGRAGPRFGKREAPAPRSRKPPRMRRESPSNTRMDGNSDPPSPMPPQHEPIINEPPQWFVSYMNAFKKEMIADLLKALDENPEDEEKRRFYKKSYFMLKSRFHSLQSQMEQQNYSQRSSGAAGPTPLMNGHSRPQNGNSRPQGRSQNVRRNGQDSHPVNNDQPIPSVSSSQPSSSPPESTQNIQGPSKPPRGDSKSRRPQKREQEKADGKAEQNDKNITAEENVPTKILNESSEDELKHPSLSKKIRSILNKVTPSNFQNLLEQMKGLNIESEDDENGIISQFFEKAIDEPMYSRTYALLCKQFVLVQPKILHLRSLIISRCESEFDKHKSLDILKAKKLEELEGTTDESSKKLLQEELRQMNEENPKEFLGNILFIGELYNEDLLSNYFLHKIIQHLLLNSNETHLEYLCKLLKISGKNFEFRDDDQSTYYEKLSEMSLQSGLSTRIKFMIEELIDVRSRGWKWRRDEAEEDHLVEIFSFSKVLDFYCGGQDKENFVEAFYKEIQPQFNLFESTNFTRELLNSAIERVQLRNEYFEIFRKDLGNKIVEWVGGEQVFLEIVLRELKLFFSHFEEIFMQIPDVWKCLAVFLGKLVREWEGELGPKKVLDMLEELKDQEMRRNFARDLIEGLERKMKGELETWMSKEGVNVGDFVGIEGNVEEKKEKKEEEGENKPVEEIEIS